MALKTQSKLIPMRIKTTSKLFPYVYLMQGSDVSFVPFKNTYEFGEDIPNTSIFSLSDLRQSEGKIIGSAEEPRCIGITIYKDGKQESIRVHPNLHIYHNSSDDDIVDHYDRISEKIFDAIKSGAYLRLDTASGKIAYIRRLFDSNHKGSLSDYIIMTQHLYLLEMTQF